MTTPRSIEAKRPCHNLSRVAYSPRLRVLMSPYTFASAQVCVSEVNWQEIEVRRNKSIYPLRPERVDCTLKCRGVEVKGSHHLPNRGELLFITILSNHVINPWMPLTFTINAHRQDLFQTCSQLHQYIYIYIKVYII